MKMTEKGKSLHLWLRDESKPFERRTALVPEHVRVLLEAGYNVSVERSSTRCFSDDEYAAVGATLEPTGSWPQAPRDAIIVGIKELPEENEPLIHRHVFFAHAYKGQTGWERTIERFQRGGGTLLDLEFLVDDSGRRVAAFGRWAGFSGAALAVDIWAHQQNVPDKTYPKIQPVRDETELLAGLRERLSRALKAANRWPRAIIIGAKGRCGSGAIDLFHKLGFPNTQLTTWDLAETAHGGPFDQLLEHDIFVNCILVQGPMKPFLTRPMLDRPRRLSVISDVSCDPKSPHNPLPIYSRTTTFSEPTLRFGITPLLDLTAIDHLPTLLPRESSQDFGEQMLEHWLSLRAQGNVWRRAEQLYRTFEEKIGFK